MMTMIDRLPFSCAMRGRYKDGQIVQHLEIHNEFANCLTGVSKDCLIIERRKNEKSR
jgi:hypothetical protein